MILVMSGVQSTSPMAATCLRSWRSDTWRHGSLEHLPCPKLSIASGDRPRSKSGETSVLPRRLDSSVPTMLFSGHPSCMTLGFLTGWRLYLFRTTLCCNCFVYTSLYGTRYGLEFFLKCVQNFRGRDPSLSHDDLQALLFFFCAGPLVYAAAFFWTDLVIFLLIFGVCCV